MRSRPLRPRRNCLLTLLCIGLLAGVAAPVAAQPPADPFTPAGTLRPFADREAFNAWFEPMVAERRRQEEERRLREEEQRRRQEEAQATARTLWALEHPGEPFVPPTVRGAPPEMAMAKPMEAAPAAPAESITNTQSAGVDEGGIVKVHGEHLVILRRGRLFTVSLAGGGLAPIAAVDAFGPNVSPGGAWYDEMVIAGDTVVVIGYSYARGGTELGLFDIDGEGALRYRATYHLRGADYYSASNYASRLIGSKLIFYTPIPIGLWHPDPYARLPALRRWHEQASADEFRVLAEPTRIYRTDEPLQPSAGVVLHSIVTCDLAEREPACEASGVLGPAGRVFYVSGRAVYVWTVGGGGKEEAAIFRLPLGGDAPSLLKAQGSPVDQFSFLEGEDGHLNVLLAARGHGEGMWASHLAKGGLNLLRVPVRAFGGPGSAARPEHYRPLPALEEGGSRITNRFVGEQLLYGAGPGWGRPKPDSKGSLQVVRLTGGEVTSLSLPHAVERIEPLAGDAVAVGSDGRNLHFSTLRLGPEGAQKVDDYVQAEASQGETRSHGFFYKSQREQEGVIGLPVRGAAESGSRQLREGSAGMLYLRNRGLRLDRIGKLDAGPLKVLNDHCRASCVDWYGNARPIFLRQRIFALLGYELVEGVVAATAEPAELKELRRVDFTPGSQDYRQAGQ